jgi:hypothetical protein
MHIKEGATSAEMEFLRISRRRAKETFRGDETSEHCFLNVGNRVKPFLSFHAILRGLRQLRASGRRACSQVFSDGGGPFCRWRRRPGLEEVHRFRVRVRLLARDRRGPG